MGVQSILPSARQRYINSNEIKNDKFGNNISDITTNKSSRKQGQTSNSCIQSEIYCKTFQNQPLVSPTILGQDGGPNKN